MASTTLTLPLYTQRGSPIPNRRSAFRLREKYLILCGAFLLVCICYSGFVFLPDTNWANESGGDSIRHKVKEALKRPEHFVIPPPLWYENKTFMLAHHEGGHDDPHRKLDQDVLKQKIEQAQIPPPNPQAQEILKKRLEETSHAPAASESEENVMRRNRIKDVSIHSLFFLFWGKYICL